MTMEQNAQPIRVAQMMTDMNYGGDGGDELLPPHGPFQSSV